MWKLQPRLSFLLVLTLGTWASAGEVKRPHIVLFLSDDHQAEFTGCYGDRVVKTPNIDRLASEGMRFSNFFAASSTCGPSRTAICTGMMPPRVGCWRNHGTSDPQTRSLPHYLKELGYRVVLTGKSDVHPKTAYPFERMVIAGQKKTTVEDFLGDHLEKNEGRPLCLLFNTRKPHAPFPKADGYAPKEIIIPPDMVDTDATRVKLTEYFTEVTQMDRELGACLDAVKKQGIQDETMFIYTSDQGGQFPRAKWNLYDAGIRMPFVVRWPGRVKPASICNSLVSAVDILPTFIEIAGGNPVPEMDGRSFLPTLLEAAKPHRDRIYGTHTGNPLHSRGYNDYAIRCLRTTTHKYILNLDPKKKWISHSTDSPEKGSGPVWDTWVEKAKHDTAAAKLIQQIYYRPAEELYDVKNDPYELNNLADDPNFNELLVSLRGELVDWRKAQGDNGEPPEVRQKEIEKQRQKAKDKDAKRGGATKPNVSTTWGTSKMPNVLVVYVDDMGIGDLSCFGGALLNRTGRKALTSFRKTRRSVDPKRKARTERLFHTTHGGLPASTGLHPR